MSIGRDKRIAKSVNYGANTQYFIPETWNSGPKVGFTREKKMEVFYSGEKKPGPATYSPKITSVKKDIPKIKFPDSQRQADL